MMDHDQIDLALHEIRQMVLVAIGATESMRRSDADHFHLPADDAEMLSFSVIDVFKRVTDLKDALYGRPTAKVVLIGGNECA